MLYYIYCLSHREEYQTIRDDKYYYLKDKNYNGDVTHLILYSRHMYFIYQTNSWIKYE